MREILYAWCESVRNSVQAWDSRWMCESWPPCSYHTTTRLKIVETQNTEFVLPKCYTPKPSISYFHINSISHITKSEPLTDATNYLKKTTTIGFMWNITSFLKDVNNTEWCREKEKEKTLLTFSCHTNVEKVMVMRQVTPPPTHLNCKKWDKEKDKRNTRLKVTVMYTEEENESHRKSKERKQM